MGSLIQNYVDLSQAYKQMKVEKSSRPLLTINTHLELYQYARLPFGISTAPALWQKAMAQVLQGIPGAVYFIDDILVTGRTRGEHEANLCRVLERIREYGLRLTKKELEFLGHLISQDGIKPTQSRIESVKAAPAPLNKQELQSFLGMVTYNTKFMPSLSQTLHPLYQLLRKNVQWSWGTDHQEAYTKVKQLLCQECMLAHYDVTKPLKLFCDASPNGLGACLVHVMPNGEERPVASLRLSLLISSSAKLCSNRAGSIGHSIRSSTVSPVPLRKRFHSGHRPPASV